MTPNSAFIAYLNSLHNIQASGANALAESQAVNPFFTDIYEPFALAERLKTLFQEPDPRVVVLSGHAGDGKSTVALDLYKALRGLVATEPLKSPLRERELIENGPAPVTIVKDMSELSAEQRRTWLVEAFAPATGSWLIVSNTGPLLTSLSDYAQSKGLDGVEDKILGALDRPLHESNLRAHALEGFPKPLLILNLSRFDNTELGSRVLGRLISHPAWEGCNDCTVQTGCPIALNHRALKEAGTLLEDRVRWLYRRISEYDQRLTLRQIVAQLAFGLTGGMGCDAAKAYVEASAASGAARGTSPLAEIVFSEGFFGYQAGRPSPIALGLRAVLLLHQTHIGGPVSPDFDRVMQEHPAADWAKLPEALAHLAQTWRAATNSPLKRAALRRLLLLFGRHRPKCEGAGDLFIDAMLRSPGLRLLDESRRLQRLALEPVDERDLLGACLDVLREAFSGFTASQFHKRDDQLFLTLRRPDRAVVQPTQMVLGSLAFRDFGLEYDPEEKAPVLFYQRGRGNERVTLNLSLPLLDYILRRSEGELGASLAPIHRAQLDSFHAKLLKLEDALPSRAGDITLLRADISGEVNAYHYLLSQDGKKLVRQR